MVTLLRMILCCSRRIFLRGNGVWRDLCIASSLVQFLDCALFVPLLFLLPPLNGQSTLLHALFSLFDVLLIIIVRIPLENPASSSPYSFLPVFSQSIELGASLFRFVSCSLRPSASLPISSILMFTIYFIFLLFYTPLGSPA
jgi:hypothetical protein